MSGTKSGVPPTPTEYSDQYKLSSATEAISIYSIANPIQGATNKKESVKAYMTLAGGFLYMCVSQVCLDSSPLSFSLSEIRLIVYLIVATIIFYILNDDSHSD